jgi:hypothetical protein
MNLYRLKSQDMLIRTEIPRFGRDETSGFFQPRHTWFGGPLRPAPA